MYSLVLQRHKEAELEEMMNINNASLIKRAALPSTPILPVRRNYIVLILILGIGLAVFLAFTRELLDSTIKSHEALEELGHPFLGIFPALDSQESGGERPFRFRKYAFECRGMCAFIANESSFMNPEQPPSTIAVSSASPQEGKSTVSIALATTMAQSGSKTLLVDADMRRPRLHKTFSIDAPVHGLSSLIIGEGNLDDAVSKDVLPGLDLLCCGPIPPNPAELLHAPGFKDLLEQLASIYDRVIFDAPPINPVSDPTVLAKMVDGLVMVVASHQTRTPALSMAVKRLGEVQAKNLGTRPQQGVTHCWHRLRLWSV